MKDIPLRKVKTLWIPLLATAIITSFLSFGRANGASAKALPWGLGWGMSEEACRERMFAAGYERVVAEMPEQSPDRTLRSFALVNGIREVGYHRRASTASEHVSTRFYNDALFLVSVRYEDFGRGFRARVLEEISGYMGSQPRRLLGPNSDMEMYAWSCGGTSAQFGYRELPKLELYFAQVEYRDTPVVTELKRLGLQ